MSTSIVRKGLEIVDPDSFGTGKASTKKSKPSFSNKNNQQFRTLQNGRKVASSKRSKSGNLSLESIRKKLKEDEDKTDLNLRRLQLLSSGSVDEVTTNKILERAGKIKKDIVKREVEEKTVFTEEDFEAFEKEYFAS